MEAGSAHIMVDCNGSEVEHSGGTWIGHVLPGTVFCLWGAWWACNMTAAWLLQSRERPYRSRCWYPMASPRRSLYYLEPILKIVVPIVAISIELFFDHNGQFQHLYCQEGTRLAGAFDESNMNNWQHTASYPGIMLSGLTDLLASFLPLPPGTSQAVLGVGWFTQAFLMSLHMKSEPQDKMVHWLLYVSMAFVTLALFLDLFTRCRNVLAGLARSLAVIFEGAWCIQTGIILFEDHPQWRVKPPYNGNLGAMMAPAAFTSILLCCLAALLAFYCLMAAAQRAGLLTEKNASRLGLALDACDAQEALAAGRGNLCHKYCAVGDSARGSEGSCGEESDHDEADGLLDSARPSSANPFRITEPIGKLEGLELNEMKALDP